MRQPAMISWSPCFCRVNGMMMNPTKKINVDKNIAKKWRLLLAKVIRDPLRSVTATRVAIFPRVAWFFELSRNAKYSHGTMMMRTANA